MTDTPRLDTWTTASHVREAAGDVSAAEISRMSMRDYAEIRRRAGLSDADPFADVYSQHTAPEHQAPEQPPAPLQEPQSAPQGLDPGSQEYFLEWRQNRARGGENAGIFDSVNSHSDAYTAAVRQQAGRTAYSQGNVTEAPRIGRVFIQDSPVQGRTMGYR